VINVYLGTTRVGVQRPDQPAEWAEDLSGEALWEALTRLLAPAGPVRPWYARRPALSVWLSGAWARPFVLDPVPGLKTRDEADAVAQSLAAERLGLARTQVVWLDAWHPERACMAVAADTQMLHRLHALATEQEWRLRGVRPWWSAALNSALAAERKPALLSLEEEGEAMTLLAGAAGEWSLVKSVVPMPSQAAAIVQRAKLHASVATDQILKVSLVGTDARTDGDSAVAGFASRWEWLA
jgi:hypothetical protein